MYSLWRPWNFHINLLGRVRLTRICSRRLNVVDRGVCILSLNIDTRSDRSVDRLDKVCHALLGRVYNLCHVNVNHLII